jgi:hypothetical protein
MIRKKPFFTKQLLTSPSDFASHTPPHATPHSYSRTLATLVTLGAPRIYSMVHMHTCPILTSGQSRSYYTYKLLRDDRIDGNVSIHNFQSYWQGANKRISSSFSCLHFGHYKADSSDKHLSALHAAKLTACARHGTPLGQWGVGLTVLIEKVRGNNNIGKMRAICLLKADFNFYNKLIFARWMMSSAQSKGQIPVEYFATKGNN